MIDEYRSDMKYLAVWLALVSAGIVAAWLSALAIGVR